MSFLDTNNKKKAFGITMAVLIALVLIMLIKVMSKFDPPIENGIAVNLGYMDDGSGDVQPLQPINSAPQPAPPQPQEAVPDQKEELLTSEEEDVPVIANTKNDKPTKKDDKPITKPIETKPVEPQQPSKETNNALNNIINGPTNPGTSTKSEGDGKGAGDKGDPNGDPYAASYYGSGSGSGGNGWGLNGRGKPTYSKVQQDCNETGTVVVKIVVNRSGNVISAEPGVRGTTNNAPCLTKPAKQIALSYKWRADDKAPQEQIGFVVVKFDVGE